MSPFFQHPLSPPTHNKPKPFKVRSEVWRCREMLEVWRFCLCGRESHRSWKGKELPVPFCTCCVDFKASRGCSVGSSREQTAGQTYLKIAFLCQLSGSLQRAKICSELIRVSLNFSKRCPEQDTV